MYKLILLCALFLCIATSHSFSQIVINPQVGLHDVSFKRELSPYETLFSASKPGYQIGLAVRTEGPFYLESGLFLASINQQYYFHYTGINRGDLPGLNLARHTSLQIPLRVGFTTGKGKGGFNLRTAVGPVLGYHFNTASKNEVAPRMVADFNEFSLAGKIGLGCDISFVTIDIDYQIGLTPSFKEDIQGLPLPPDIYGKQTRNNTLFVSAGVKL